MLLKVFKFNNKGFTLIELSIVIVIIGLIVAGVVGGQALVKQAKLRAQVAEFEKYKMTILTFSLEYNALPGDISNANAYWPGCNSGATATQCNGNGNGRVGYRPNDSGSSNFTNDSEPYRAWQHLSLSKIIPEIYTGVSTGGNNVGLQYGDVPFSRHVGGRYALWTATGGSQDGLALSLQGTGPGANNGDSVLSVKNAMYIDKKMDDGIAMLGNLQARNGNGVGANGCILGNDYNPANLSSDSLNCFLRYFGLDGIAN